MADYKLLGLRELKSRKTKYGFSMYLYDILNLSKFIVSTVGDTDPAGYSIKVNTTGQEVTIHTDSDDLAARMRKWIV